MVDSPFLAGGGEMGRHIRSHDWLVTPLGHPVQWPASLRTVVRIMLTTNHPMFIFWGAEHRCLYNDAYSASLGAEKHPGILGQRGEDAWPEIWPVISPQIRQVLTGGGATWHENQLVPIVRNGTLEPVYWTYSFSPIDDEHATNGVGGVLVVTTETTTQVQSGQQLQQTEARWRSLFTQAPGFMALLTGPDHRFEFANPRYSELVGITDLVGRTVLDAMPEVKEQGFIAQLDEVYRTGQPFSGRAAPLVLAGADQAKGRLRFVDFVFQPVIDEHGVVNGIFVEGSDVTERELATAALKESEARLDGVMAAAEIGVWAWQVADHRFEHDTNLARLYGRADDVALTEDTIVSGCHAEDRGVLRAAFVDALRTGSFNVREYRTVAPDGTTRWLAGRGRLHRADDGTPLTLNGLMIDISDLKSMEEVLKASDRKKDEFLAILAHELRNPLAPICNAARILATDPLGASELAWCRDVISRQVQHMAMLLDDLLDVARITENRLRLMPELVSIAALTTTAIEIAMPAITARGHTLHVVLPDEPVSLQVDPGRIAQVIANVLNNAARYTSEHGEITLSASRNGSDIEVTVRDTGIGIALEHRERIFEMFAQVDTVGERPHGGLGIGLALARGLVRLHGGHLRVFSDGLGSGSTFTVSLPALPQGVTTTAAARRAAPVIDMQRHRVLIADDNVDAAESLALLLQLHGYVTRVVHDGRQAVDAYLEFSPHIALIDLGMPELDGFEVAAQIRGMSVGSSLLLAAVTGWGQEEHMRQTQAAGFDMHFTKPVHIDELLEALATAVAGTTTA